MREIKFRGKRLDNGEWVEGYYCKHIKRQVCPMGDALKPEDVAHLIIFSGFADWNMPKPLQAVDVEPVTVGQYIGRKDKNGVEIYEGDILGGILSGSVVVWVPDEVRFGIGCGEVREVFFEELEQNELEIIGNIFDNPEWIEEAGEHD